MLAFSRVVLFRLSDQSVLGHERIVGLRFLLAGVDGQLRLCRQSSETDGQQQDGSDYFHRFTEFMHE